MEVTSANSEERAAEVDVDPGRAPNLSPSAGPAFISYVHEDSTTVDRLETALRVANIAVWRDRADLMPGDDWRQAIRQAISETSAVFIACFSRNTEARGQSYMFEELAQAIEQARQRPPGRRWLLPVQLSECQLPTYELGGGRLLSHIHAARLYVDWEAEVAKLIAVIRSAPDVLGGRPSDAETVALGAEASVAQHMPTAVRGYARRNDIERDIVRVFSHVAYTSPTRFQAVQNGCGRSYWTARWRSLNDDVTIRAFPGPHDADVNTGYPVPPLEGEAAGYLASNICERPCFAFGDSSDRSTLVDVAVEWQYWDASP